MKDKKTFPWSELLKKWFVYCTILYVLVMFFVIYLGLPYLNLTDMSFYLTLMLAISYPITVILILIKK